MRGSREELNNAEIEVIVESLQYSKDRVASGTAPYQQKNSKLRAMDAVIAKVKAMRDGT
jgi:acetoacetate decarboxylase